MADYDKLLQIPRGTKARLEQIKLDLLVNTIVFATDTKELGVKLSNGNIEYFMNATDINARVDLNEMAYFNYAGSIYGAKYNLLANAWQDMKDSESVLFDIPLMLAAPNQELGGMTIDLYVGTNGQLQALYDACVNETIPPTRDVYYVNNVATSYRGDVSGDVGFPIPLYNFGTFDSNNNASFLIGDLTPLSMGLGLVLAKFVNVSIPNNNIVIQQGFEFDNESGIIPNSVTSIEAAAFGNWTSNNQPLVIPNSVTSIGLAAFGNWSSNNQPLVIPESVTNIRGYAFATWTLVPYVEMKRTTPPTLGNADAFGQQNNAPIYVPNDSVEAYKTATNWVSLADRIFPISDKDNTYTKGEIDLMIGNIDDILDSILGV